MPTYYVTKVRKQYSSDSTHTHIIGVVTVSNNFYTNQEVVNSIKTGDNWLTSVQGQPNARIRELSWCPAQRCMLAPYLTTASDHSTANNLENLPPG